MKEKSLRSEQKIDVEKLGEREGLWTIRRAGGEIFRVNDIGKSSDRQRELLAKLEARAKECPGLYPIQLEEDFRRIAVDLVGQKDEAICGVLEVMWQRPDETLQMNAQSLIGRGHGLAEKGAGGLQAGGTGKG